MKEMIIKLETEKNFIDMELNKLKLHDENMKQENHRCKKYINDLGDKVFEAEKG